jgi:drug/metabolite transporter (DMT)-like permease
VAILFSLEPVFAAVTSLLLGAERLNLRTLAGGGLVLCGVLLAELKGSGPLAPESAVSGVD